MKLSQRAGDSIRLYISELEKQSEKFNLHSFAARTLYREVVENSLIFADVLSQKSDICDGFRICDIGSGAGIPGLILKIALEQASIDLIESNHKKAAFLKTTAQKLALVNLSVINADVSEIARRPGKCYNAVVGRAFGERFLKYAEKLAIRGGMILYFWKSADAPGFRKRPAKVFEFKHGSVLFWNNG